ncbi:hypothetical protein O1M63_04540 [Streptomyces mirabilis]|nr:hypothetical protein [Streptomyces mirabilis]
MGAPYDAVPEQARMTLFGCHFQYRPNEFAFVLPASYSAKERALLVQLAAQRLMAEGIGVNFRRATPLPPPLPASAAASRTTVATGSKSPSRRQNTASASRSYRCPRPIPTSGCCCTTWPTSSTPSPTSFRSPTRSARIRH